MAEDLFSKYPTASWRVGDNPEDAIYFPVLEITETGGNRIVRHKRPHRPGAKLEDTGEQEVVWTFTAIFNNSIQEGVQNGEPLYPKTLRRIIRSFSSKETGTLVLPTVGKVRARAESYTRKEMPEERDTGYLELTFVEDNEESLARAALNPPSVVATLVKLSEQTVFTQQRIGEWNDGLVSLTEFASEIQGLLLAPGRAAADLNAIIRSHRRAIQRIIDAATTAGNETGSLFVQPRGSPAERQLRTMQDREALAEVERTSSRPRTKSFVVDVERTSIYDIAARVDQDAGELMDLNAARITDPFLLERGEVIRVFEATP